MGIFDIPPSGSSLNDLMRESISESMHRIYALDKLAEEKLNLLRLSSLPLYPEPLKLTHLETPLNLSYGRGSSRDIGAEVKTIERYYSWSDKEREAKKLGYSGYREFLKECDKRGVNKKQCKKHGS
jgi:hypothetical protein